MNYVICIPIIQLKKWGSAINTKSYSNLKTMCSGQAFYSSIISYWHTKLIFSGLARGLKRSVLTFYEVAEEGLSLTVSLFRQTLAYGHSAGRETRVSFQREIIWRQCELTLSQWYYLMPLFIFPALECAYGFCYKIICSSSLLKKK